jgi:radical SAM superfamily enzyme YgiQ (UPF0313 family)
MRVTFVAIGWEQLGISLLSAIAKEKGHEVNLAFSSALFNDRAHFNIPALAALFDDRKKVIASIYKNQPDVLAFSVLTANYQWMLGIAGEIRKQLPHVKVIFGGVHPSAVPERVLARPEVDYVCVGEGEAAFPSILEAIEKKDTRRVIPNARYKLPDGQVVKGPQAAFIQDLDSLPIFDKVLWEDHIPIGDSYITMAARGCPYRCTFCFNNFFARLPGRGAGKYVRRRSAGHMMRELRLAKRRYKLNVIEFFDDVFTLDKKWLKVFLDQYKTEIRVPFQCFTHVKFVDEDVALWLSEAGCFSAQIGIQSMDDEYKRRVARRHETTEDVERTIRIMRKYKIKAKFDHMFGLPGEGIEAQETARKFYAESPPDNIQTYWTNYFPGTELIQQGLAQGLITKEDVERIHEGLDCDIYSNSNHNIDARKMKLYHAYQIIFKLMPHLPKGIRRRLVPDFFRYVPVRLCVILSFMADVMIGLIKLSPDHVLYARYYLYSIGRFLIEKAGGPPRPATVRFSGRVPPLRC